MKTNTVNVRTALSMAQWVPLRERVELSLVVMILTAVGEVVLASRGLEAGAVVVMGAANGMMFSALWVVPSLQIGNVVRSMVLGFVWIVLSRAIASQIMTLLMVTAPVQEVFSR